MTVVGAPNPGGVGTLQGTGNLTIAGGGTTIFAAANTFSGSITIAGGTLAILSSSTGTGAITVNDGCTLNVTASGASQLQPSTLTLGSANGATIGFSNVTSTTTAPLNPGTLTLTGVNTINVLSGTLAVGSSYPLIKYTTLAGAGSYVLGTIPPGFSAI